jgi:hypothetical protein
MGIGSCLLLVTLSWQPPGGLSTEDLDAYAARVHIVL